MKIQLSPTRIVKDATTVWSEAGPEVDIVMDLKNLTFRPGSIEEIYSFHVLDHLFPEDTVVALNNWRQCMKTGALIYVVVDNFEFICRGFVGGDISIQLLNNLYAHPTQFTQDHLVYSIDKAGFKDPDMSVWNADKVADLFTRSQSELVLSVKKYE